MRVIGITGGVGAGKSEILSYIDRNYNCMVIKADEAAHQVEQQGQPCYDRLIALLSPDILKADGTIHKGKMSEKIFADPEMLQQVNDIVHPAVKEFILQVIKEQKRINRLDFLLIEAALLIEDGYINIADELWYIYAKEEVRRKRLKEARNYSDAKIDSIMSRQLKEEEFRKYCKVVIDNSGELAIAYRIIDEKLGEYLWQN